MLGKLHASGFDTKSYTDARQKYREVANDIKPSATARKKQKYQYVSEKRKVLRALADSKAKDVAPKAGALRVDWATWLVSDMQDEGSDNDVDSKDIEEEEEEEMSDDDLCGVEVDHAQTVFELCADVLRAQVFVVHQGKC